jgi:adenylate cyclase
MSVHAKIGRNSLRWCINGPRNNFRMQSKRKDFGTQDPDAELVLVSGEMQKHFPLTSRDVCRIGRTPDNSIQLSANLVSRRHAMVQPGEFSAFMIVDLGSRNGTYVNGSRITSSRPLQNGDVISIGGEELLFIQSGVSGTSENSRIGPDATMVERPVSEITVAVVDIRGYTKICQNVGEVRAAEMMHAFNTEAGTLLGDLNAWGVKYIGDAVMAVWVNHGPPKQFVFRALQAISGLMDIAAGLQDRFHLDSPVLLRAALNIGAASVGNMGSKAAPDYTAIGDVVNKVFRLESCAGDLQADLVLSGHVYNVLQRGIDPKKLMIGKRVQLKGYADSELVYTLDKDQLRSILERADSNARPSSAL